MILKTLNDWLAEGRMVRRGEHAEFYEVSVEDTSHGCPLFHEEQTLSWRSGETIIITRDEWKAARRAWGSRIMAAAYPDDDCGPSI